MADRETGGSVTQAGEGQAFLTYDTIATEAGVHRGTAIKAVKALLEAGHIKAAEQSNGRVANTYSMATAGIQATLFGGAPEMPPEKKRGRRRNVQAKPKLDPAPSAARMPPERIMRAFYRSQSIGEQVGRLIDAGRALGVELDAGRLGAALKKGNKSEIAERLGIALFKNVEVPEDFALKNLNGRANAQTRRSDRRTAGTASDDAERIKTGDY